MRHGRRKGGLKCRPKLLSQAYDEFLRQLLDAVTRISNSTNDCETQRIPKQLSARSRPHSTAAHSWWTAWRMATPHSSKWTADVFFQA